MNLDSERCTLVWMYGSRLEPDAWLNMYIPAMHHDAAGARSWIRRRKKKRPKKRVHQQHVAATR